MSFKPLSLSHAATKPLLTVFSNVFRIQVEERRMCEAGDPLCQLKFVAAGQSLHTRLWTPPGQPQAVDVPVSVFLSLPYASPSSFPK